MPKKKKSRPKPKTKKRKVEVVRVAIVPLTEVLPIIAKTAKRKPDANQTAFRVLNEATRDK